MLTLAQACTYLKLPAPGADLAADEEVQALLEAALSTFRVQSKRRWPTEGEPTLTVAVDPDADPVVYRFVRYLDPAVLSPDEQKTALQWVRLALGHWYENRQSVVVDSRAAAVEVPQTCDMLMNLLREPTI